MSSQNLPTVLQESFVLDSKRVIAQAKDENWAEIWLGVTDYAPPLFAFQIGGEPPKFARPPVFLQKETFRIISLYNSASPLGKKRLVDYLLVLVLTNTLGGVYPHSHDDKFMDQVTLDSDEETVDALRVNIQTYVDFVAQKWKETNNVATLIVDTSTNAPANKRQKKEHAAKAKISIDATGSDVKVTVDSRVEFTIRTNRAPKEPR